jgi:integrase
MKMDKEHYIPLSDAAIKLLESLPRFEGNNYIFPGNSTVGMHEKAMRNTINSMHNAKKQMYGKGWVDPKQNNRKITVHGFRSTFKDWARETTNHEKDTSEYALAHKLPDPVEGAYARGVMLAKRVHLMSDWARYCDTVQSAAKDNVVSIRKAM